MAAYTTESLLTEVHTTTYDVCFLNINLYLTKVVNSRSNYQSIQHIGEGRTC